MLKSIGKALLILLAAILLLVGGLLAYLTLTEYKPIEEELVPIEAVAGKGIESGASFKVFSFNIGYGGLGEQSDFFMDGGKEVRPASAEIIETNLQGIESILEKNHADFYLLQEVDADSKRSYGIDERARLREGLEVDAAYALNFSCGYVPFPLPTIGRVQSGLYTMSAYSISQGGASRIALPNPFSWPLRTANLKRCLLITRVPVEGTDKELVLVNLHLEAYDSGEGKAAQTARLMSFLDVEYNKGNYVVAGGDFNCGFPVVDSSLWPIVEQGNYVPGVIEEDALPVGFRWAVDPNEATCRLLNKPLHAPGTNQFYVIDGFIISQNIELLGVETVDEAFVYSDHNPVLLEARLLP